MTSEKHKENHQIPSDILDDLASRFIINVPVEERADFIRICFQIELAHWFYLDFYCSTEEVKLVPCGIKQFALHIFHHIPFLKEHLQRLNDIMNDFKQYKMSVPTYGAILMTSDRRRVLLVQSYWAKSSWGFPKGKVNEDEDPLHCAVREVFEETGFDTTRLVRPDDYIEGVLNYQYTRLYIVPDVPEDTVFVPRTRKEIKACDWFQLDFLPSHKTDTVCKSTLGINANSFFMIMPFVKRLKRWLADHAPTNVHAAQSAPPFGAFAGNGPIRIAKRNNGPTVNAAALPTQPAQANASNKRRQRNKSTGDLEGFKILPAPEPVTAKPVAPAATSRAANLLQVAAAVSSTTTTPINTNTNLTASQAKSRVFSKTKSGTFKRQLFTAGGSTASVPVDSSGTSASNNSDVSRTSNPLAVIRAVTGRPAQSNQSAKSQQSLAKSGPTAAPSPPPTIAANFNGAADNGVAATNPQAKPRINGKLKKRRSIESFLNALNIDPAIQRWKHFTFADRSAIQSTLPPFRIQMIHQ